MKYTIYLLLICTSLSFISCLGKSQAEEDEEIIQDYIVKNNLTATKHASGLFYIIKTEGTGNNPTLSNKVTVHYKGYLTNGSQFDGTTTQPKTFDLVGPLSVIPGWQIGIPLIKKGGDIKLLIPSALGYGTSATGPIPANSVLVFDIQLVEIK